MDGRLYSESDSRRYGESVTLTRMLKFFITGHKGFETALFHEVREIVSQSKTDDFSLKKVYGGIEITGYLEQAYRICIHSRLANRVYLQLKAFRADTEQALYENVYNEDWTKHITSRHSFAVSASLSRSNLDHSHYASLKVKDAIVDYFRNTVSSRPVIEKEQPDIHVHLNIHKNNATLSLDLSGQSLHRRGYRLQHSGAPLKENLAAALLFQSGWNAETAQHNSLIDPMCGSGTFAIEAAMIASKIPPGLDRQYFGFSRWLQHDRAVWEQCLAEAEEGIDAEAECEILACDSSDKAIEIAKDNAMRAGVESLIEFRVQDINQLTPDQVQKPPIILFNPPYGERLQAEQGLAPLYTLMGKVFKSFSGASVNIISANPDLLHRMRMNRISKKAVSNGPISCVFATFEAGEQPEQSDNEKPVVITAPAFQLSENDPEANALSNRLLKNQKHLSRWARRNDISCYRIYDADLPEFAFALDCYTNALNTDETWFHLQEYQAPKTIDPEKAQHRIQLAQVVVKKVFGVDDSALFCKLRQRQRGKHQYEKQDKQGELFQVAEGPARLLINLTDYLDSGLFLDHRLMRHMIYQQARDKKILNLFCYTASVSVQAALGGAREVVSADMSGTYINWAKENFELNDLKEGDQYQFLQADCIDLLRKPAGYDLEQDFDLIFLDPPSFSNSKKMRDTLDIQRDHEELIELSMRLLKPDGKLIFSTNKKGFKLGESITSKYQVVDVTRQTIPEDFKRRPKIHQCWEIHS